MDITIILGITGAFLILLAFTLHQVGVWSEEDLIYDLINFLGSGLLIWYSILLSSIPFIVLNSIWAFVSLRDVICHFVEKQSLKKGIFCTKTKNNQ